MSLRVLLSRLGLPRGLAPTMMTNLCIQASGVISGVLAARLLGPTGRGELATVLFWPSIIATIGLFGVNWTLARRAGQDPRSTTGLVRLAVLWGTVAGLAFLLIGWVLMPALLGGQRHDLVTTARLFLLAIPLNFILNNLLGLDQGASRFLAYNLTRLVFYPFYLGLVLVGWWLDSATVLWFVLANLVASSITVGVRVGRQWRDLQTTRIEMRMASSILRESVPYGLAAVVRGAAQQFDLLLVILLFDSTKIGLYAAALAFASIHTPVAAALGIVTFSANSGARSPLEVGRHLVQTVKHGIVLNAVGTLAVGSLAPVLLIPMFGAEFRLAIAPCVVLAVAAGVAGLAGGVNEGLRGAGHPWPGTIGQGLGALVTGLVGLALVAPMGLLGIGWASLAGACVQLATVVTWASWRFDLVQRIINSDARESWRA